MKHFSCSMHLVLVDTIYRCLYFVALVKSPTKSSEAYYPFGRPGGGAPIRDNKGKVRANVIGVIENEKLVSF